MSLDPGAIPDADVLAFETFVRVRFHEVDALGHVNNAAYLNYLEQAAIDHATFLGLDLPQLQGLGGVFVARRHEIMFLKPVFAGELLRVVTWLGEPRGARVDRHYLRSLRQRPRWLSQVVRPRMPACQQTRQSWPEPQLNGCSPTIKVGLDAYPTKSSGC